MGLTTELSPEETEVTMKTVESAVWTEVAMFSGSRVGGGEKGLKAGGYGQLTAIGLGGEDAL
jgi:hypothetical protein